MHGRHKRCWTIRPGRPLSRICSQFRRDRFDRVRVRMVYRRRPRRRKLRVRLLYRRVAVTPDERLPEPGCPSREHRGLDRFFGGLCLGGWLGLAAHQPIRLWPHQGVNSIREIVVGHRLAGRRPVLRIPHETPSNKVTQGRRPLGRLEDRVHRVRGHLKRC